MRGRTIVLLSIIAILVGIVVVTTLNPEYERVVEYRDHRIPYTQYLRGKKFLYPGHYVDNERLVDQAYMKLANRLLNDYLQDKNDTLLIKEVFRISNEHNLRSRTKIISIDSLVKNRDTLLDTTIWIW